MPKASYFFITITHQSPQSTILPTPVSPKPKLILNSFLVTGNSKNNNSPVASCSASQLTSIIDKFFRNQHVLEENSDVEFKIFCLDLNTGISVRIYLNPIV